MECSVRSELNKLKILDLLRKLLFIVILLLIRVRFYSIEINRKVMGSRKLGFLSRKMINVEWKVDKGSRKQMIKD